MPESSTQILDSLAFGDLPKDERTLVSPGEWYRQWSAREGFEPDGAQVEALRHIERLYRELIEHKKYRQGFLARRFGKKRPPRGLYLHGGVGRGKTALMDAFYRLVPLRRKVRIHFHHFMRNIHQELALLKREEDPLEIVSDRLERKYRLICFDEFHVNDIADAMILARLLGGLFERGVVFTMTSNYAPDDLWKDGIQRDRFLPAIRAIKENMDVVNMDGGVDHRLRTLERHPVYYTPAGEAMQAALRARFAELAQSSAREGFIEIYDRDIATLGTGMGVAWFDFQALCGGPRSQLDYLEIAKEFHTVILSDVPRMTAKESDKARRLTWLVDILYDNRVKLIMSAAAEVDRLFGDDPGFDESIRAAAREFARTVSRLKDMQTRDYLMQPKLRASNLLTELDT